MKHSKGNIHNIETFGTFDGPGIRYVLFLQGCPFKCGFCHNRDSWSTKTNSLMSVDDVMQDYANYEAFYKKGGITVSGGEPLMQASFVYDLFKTAKNKHIHTTLDTSAACYNPKNNAIIKDVLSQTDLVLLDIKHIDKQAHQTLTGSSNHHVLAFLDLLEALNIKTIIRHVLIPTINDDEQSILSLQNHLKHYHTIEKVEVLPYHTNGKHKWTDLGLDYPLEGIPPMEKSVAMAVEKRLNQNLPLHQTLSSVQKDYA